MRPQAARWWSQNDAEMDEKRKSKRRHVTAAVVQPFGHHLKSRLSRAFTSNHPTLCGVQLTKRGFSNPQAYLIHALRKTGSDNLMSATFA